MFVIASEVSSSSSIERSAFQGLTAVKVVLQSCVVNEVVDRMGIDCVTTLESPYHAASTDEKQ